MRVLFCAQLIFLEQYIQMRTVLFRFHRFAFLSLAHIHIHERVADLEKEACILRDEKTAGYSVRQWVSWCLQRLCSSKWKNSG